MAYNLILRAIEAPGGSANAHVVHIHYANYANATEGNRAWPTYSSVAKACHLKKRQTVAAAVEENIRLGYLVPIGDINDRQTWAKQVYPDGKWAYIFTVKAPPLHHTKDSISGAEDVRKTDTLNNQDAENSGTPTPQGVRKTDIEGVRKTDTIHGIYSNLGIGTTESPLKYNNPTTNQPIEYSTAKDGGGGGEIVSAKDKTGKDAQAVRQRDVAKAVIEKLHADGIPQDEASTKCKAVWEQFLAEAQQLKATGWAGINNKRNYLTAMLYRMAHEGPKASTAAQTSPRKLPDILAALREHYRQVYPQQAHDIDLIVSEDSLPVYTINTIKAKEAQGWAGIASPLSWVQAKLDGLVYGEVEAAKARQREADSRYLQRLRSHLADVSYYCDLADIPEAQRQQFAAEKRNLEAAIAAVKARLSA